MGSILREVLMPRGAGKEEEEEGEEEEEEGEEGGYWCLKLE